MGLLGLPEGFMYPFGGDLNRTVAMAIQPLATDSLNNFRTKMGDGRFIARFACSVSVRLAGNRLKHAQIGYLLRRSNDKMLFMGGGAAFYSLLTLKTSPYLSL